MNDDQQQQPAAYEGWAVLELMGHRRLGGYVREVAQFGTAMIRIDVPAESEDGQPVTQFYGGQSIYCLSPVTEESARAVARHSRPRPVHQYELVPPATALPTFGEPDPWDQPDWHERDDDDEDDDDEEPPL
jgi:hypothetical protein